MDSLDSTGVEEDSFGTGGLTTVDMGLSKAESVSTIIIDHMNLHSDIYRNTNVANFVQAGSLNGVEVVDNCGLRQTVRARRSGFETNTPKELTFDSGNPFL
jgi:hypothetical protein